MLVCVKCVCVCLKCVHVCGLVVQPLTCVWNLCVRPLPPPCRVTGPPSHLARRGRELGVFLSLVLGVHVAFNFFFFFLSSGCAI